MRPLKFRQPILTKDGFERWHYWGFTERGMFSGPMPPLDRESYQFTGLLDRHGKEIWEGDKVIHTSFPNLAEPVVFHSGAFWVKQILLSTYHSSVVEVIGNIFEVGSH
jgi:hypothetical protein